ncbi:origin recognition complex subunit 1 [Aspergillus udagawae]|uniref:Origin recognition complex subunit 1 n=2 Tax=Aspergillus udagawae TaxID=91492 RepID=A0A8H3S1H3_9EURO|nr:origin recognition complex subunit 1 [Aspergillus udagawae]GFF45268.1 origin recognition complex subunit 1 [Aspergillus udagawae]GFF84466.1 origin recognition complex subunit 1 [Aspergillus udagawae]GFG17138.1 origin recognition complex subunit 1 [Aspergillus udagawae]GFG24589.1 origin recognition complex subunit 1 [Aspergillus udagawae]
MAVPSGGEFESTPSRRRSARQRAQLWMTKGGLVRDDSDDELGDEDLPWHWIYDAEEEDTKSKDTTPATDEPETKSARRRAARPNAKRRRNIIGARMGSFECRLGQVVLLKSPEPGKDWVGIITDFLEEEDDEAEDGVVKSVNIMWLASPDEFMSTKNRRRADALPNEQYLTADFNVNPITSINGKATVMSKDAFFAKYPDGTPPKGKEELAEFNKCIICRRGVNQLQGRYTDEFIWEDVYREDKVHDLITMVKDGLKAAKKRKHVDDDYIDTKEDEDFAPSTPRKKQKVASSTTPQSRRKKALTTPSHKRIVVKKPLEFTPLGTRVLPPSHFDSPYRQARTLLHVSTVPTSLPCRKTEFDTVYNHLSAAIMEGTGTCIYISGTPGTGKTATVREVVAQLNAAVLAEEMDDFIFVEINGMKVTDPHQSYSLLWEALKGDRVSPSHALDLLEREFSHPSPRRVSCVVLMDELDQLVTKNQSVMYNFFNWPALRHSRLIVLAVANTMDLPERTLSNKISSRLGLTRITFPGYKHTDLMEIISTRLANVPGNIVDADAVQFASRKVAAVSGDARRALDICRRAVEIAEQSSEAAKIEDFDAEQNGDDNESLPPTPSKTPARRQKSTSKQTVKVESPQKNTAQKQTAGRVTIATIKQAIQEATSTPLQQSLRSLPLSAKLFLAALLARVKRTGIAESTFGDVIDEAKRIADAAVAVASTGIKDFLLAGNNGGRVRALGFAAMELMNSGVLALENGAGVKGPLGGSAIPSRGDRSGKVRLRVAPEDVRAAFREDIEAKGLGLGMDQ